MLYSPFCHCFIFCIGTLVMNFVNFVKQIEHFAGHPLNSNNSFHTYMHVFQHLCSFIFFLFIFLVEDKRKNNNILTVESYIFIYPSSNVKFLWKVYWIYSKWLLKNIVTILQQQPNSLSKQCHSYLDKSC